MEGVTDVRTGRAADHKIQVVDRQPFLLQRLMAGLGSQVNDVFAGGSPILQIEFPLAARHRPVSCWVWPRVVLDWRPLDFQ